MFHSSASRIVHVTKSTRSRGADAVIQSINDVLRALRKRDPGAAKPCNFALSPILIKPPKSCTLIAPMSKDPAEWSLTQDYTEINSGRTVKLFGKYRGKKLVPQTLSTIIWRHYLHPPDKSLAPNGERCGP
jgi:hypothetical protein